MANRYYRAASADTTSNRRVQDVLGNKEDAAVAAVGTTSSLVAYLKGLLGIANAHLPLTVASATKVMVNGDTLFTVTGAPIEILHLMSVCITLNDATASTLQYSVTHATLGAVTISNASASLANAAAGSFVTLQKTALSTAALLSTEGATIASTGPSTIIMLPGLITAVIGTGSTTGTWKHYLVYRPFGAGVTVV